MSATPIDRGGSKIEPGLLLGHTWIIGEFLGRGGMGEVWRCQHIELGTEHAVKIILPELAENPKFVALFTGEAKRLSRVRNDAVVSYEGLFRDEWERRYLVMEFVDGPSLSKILECRCLTIADIKLLRNRVALGLAAAHERGIFHRDISPDNIILPNERVESAKIIDFGIAKSADPADRTLIGGDFAGKYSFVSPEQIGLFGGKVDGRSDIYSLGLVLAAAAIGHGERLDMGASPASMIEARKTVPDLTRLPAEIRPLIGWMLEPDPDRRPQSMAALADFERWSPLPVEEPPPRSNPAPLRADLSTALDPFGERPTPPLSSMPPAPMRRKAVRRKGRMVATILAFGLAVSLAGGAFYYFERSPVDLQAIDAQSRQLLAGFDCALADTGVSAVFFGAAIQLNGLMGSFDDKTRLKAILGRIDRVAEVDDRTVVTPSPLCAAAVTVAGLMPARIGPGPSIEPPGGALGRVLQEANLASLIIQQNPENFGFAYVDAFLPDGSVVHLLPTPERTNNLLLKAQRTLLHQAGAAAGVDGPLIVTALSAPKLLLTAQRPAREPAANYLAALLPALDELLKRPDQPKPTGAWKIFLNASRP